MPGPALVIAGLAAVLGARQIQADRWAAAQPVVVIATATAGEPAWPSRPAHGKALVEVLAGVDDAAIPWLTHAAVRDVTDAAWGAVLTDVQQHMSAATAKQYTDGGTTSQERATDAHEGTHGINFDLRYGQQQKGGFELGTKVNTLYVLDDRYVMLLEPPMSKAEVAARVPVPLREMRFQLYVAEQEGWNDRPLYLFDEWVAYTNGAATIIDRERRGLADKLLTIHDTGASLIEFSVYALATLQAISEEAPAHLREQPALAAFTAWNLRRAFELFELTRTIKRTRWAEAETYVAELRTGVSAAALRGFATATWGEAWTREVLGF